MLEFFHTEAAARRLQGLEEAVAVIQEELRNARMSALATAVLEAFIGKPDVQAIRIAITQQEQPNLMPSAGEDRWLHCAVTLEPSGTLLDLPPGTLPASVIGEGEFRIERRGIQLMLKMFEDSREEAVAKLSAAMGSCFLHVFHKATANVLT